MDSLVLLSRSQNVSILQLLTERITINPRVRSSVVYNFHVHFRIADSIVEEALQSALCKDVPPPLEEIAHAAGYRCVASLQRRYRDLCAAVSRKRCANLVRTVRPPSRSENSAAREKIQYVLSEALRDGAPVSLRSLAEKIGVNKRRLYKGFHDLRKALVARNQSLRQQLRLQRRAGIEEILRKALIAVPVPTRTEIAHRLGYKSVSALTRCFPEQSAALKLRRTLSL
jgi:AraC-like DNA-binding protein